MPAKKSTPVKKPVSGKKPIGLTSAIGPKATTIVVICVMAGGILVAARQQQSKPKALPDPVMSAEMAAASPTTASKRAGANAASATSAPSAVSTATTVTVSGTAPKAPPVTITGCLEAAGDTFRLKDTSGADAPKSRSWKSGFLKKGPATVDVVDGTHTLRMANQVGHRVSVTGTLVDHEMQARSLRRLTSSCGERP
jgi:hypothetical protein